MPPLVVDPESLTITVMELVPKVLVGAAKVRFAVLPFCTMAGKVLKTKLLVLLTVKLRVWLDSLVGPALRPVRRLLIVTVPAFSAESTRLVASVARGGWLTAVMVRVNLLVVVAVPLPATSLISAAPLA